MSEPPTEAPAPRKRRRRRKKKTPADGAARVETQAGRDAPSPPQVRPSERPEKRASADDLAQAVFRSLDALVSRIAREEGLAVPGPEVEATLVPLVLGRRAGREAALVAHLRDHLRVAHGEHANFVEGAVYCFHTDQPESVYSRPPKPTDVFAGYAANGKPEWVGFANLCLERKEPRVDRLFGESPEVLAMVIWADELGAGLLPEFARGRLGWKLLGQVVLGFVPRDFELKSREERVALTLQVVETTEPDSRGGVTRRLRLNVIGLPVATIAELAANGDGTSPAEAFRKVIRATRGRVDALGRRAALAYRQGGRFDLDEPVAQLLTRLRGDVLRVLKTRHYRTQHAVERHQSGERPTSLAIADALAAGEGRFFRDEHKDTVVVLGPKNRVHVFSTSGRHVTSLELMPNEVARRLELKRWRFLERALSELFKGSLKRQLGAES